MHSSIIQISAKVISHDKFLRQDDLKFGQNTEVDYATKLHGMAAVREIEAFSTISSIRELLSLNSDGTLIFKGGVASWLKQRIERIKVLTQKLAPDDVLNSTFTVQQICEAFYNPLDIDTLFVVGDSKTAEASIALLRLLANVEQGSKLYIGSVFDYHF